MFERDFSFFSEVANQRCLREDYSCMPVLQIDSPTTKLCCAEGKFLQVKVSLIDIEFNECVYQNGLHSSLKTSRTQSDSQQQTNADTLRLIPSALLDMLQSRCVLVTDVFKFDYRCHSPVTSRFKHSRLRLVHVCRWKKETKGPFYLNLRVMITAEPRTHEAVTPRKLIIGCSDKVIRWLSNTLWQGSMITAFAELKKHQGGVQWNTDSKVEYSCRENI